MKETKRMMDQLLAMSNVAYDKFPAMSKVAYEKLSAMLSLKVVKAPEYRS